MSSADIKSKLKASRDAIQKKDWTEAKDAAKDVLEQESDNYNANVFLGLALLNLEEFPASEAAYNKAIELQPNQVLAYQGLEKFYTLRKDWQKLAQVLLNEADLHLQSQDAVKCGEAIQRLIEIQREEGGKRLTAEALSFLLPGSKYYDLLVTLPQPQPAGRHSSTFDVEMAIHMHPLRTITEVIQLHEEVEQRNIDQEVERKRMRIEGAGKTKETLRNEAGITVWKQSPLPGLYEQVMNHREASDEQRREAEGKLLRYLHRLLLALPSDSPTSSVKAPRGTAAESEHPLEGTSSEHDEKTSVHNRIQEMVRGMVIVGVPDDLAWSVHLEWQDFYQLAALPRQTLRQFIDLFPRSGRADSFRALLLALQDEQYLREVEEAKKIGDVDHGDDDLEPLDYAVRALESSPDSSLSQWIAAKLYLLERDYISANESATAAASRIDLIQHSADAMLPSVLRALRSIQGVSLARSGSGTTQHRSKAIRLLDEALQDQKEGFLDVEAIMARALIETESQKWQAAQALYERVAQKTGAQEHDEDERKLSIHKDPQTEAQAELAWCLVSLGRLEDGKAELRQVIEILDADGSKTDAQQLFQASDRARAWWRLGQCSLGQNNDGNGDIADAFNCYITALKRDPSFAPAFTSLGTHYESYASPPDPARSSKCFQKAFELDSREFHAAYKLADHYANERDWDLVSLIAKRVIEGEGGSRALSGDSSALAAQQRYKPQNAWAWKAIGSVRLEKGDPELAISPLQIALRSTPEDVAIWQRLGEAYFKTGRYTAALKAFAQALELDPSSWQTMYYVAEVRRELGQFEEAIDLFDEILSQHKEDVFLGVRVANGETHLLKGRQEFESGYGKRAEHSLELALHHAICAIQEDAHLRSPWKIVTDALFTLGRFGTISNVQSLLENSVDPLLEIVSAKYASVDTDLPAIDAVTKETAQDKIRFCQERPQDHALATLSTCVYLCKLRVILSGSDNQSLPSAWADLSTVLSRYSHLLTLAGDESSTSQLTKQSISCIKAALNHEPANASFWMTLGNLTFLNSVQIAQHAYIRAIESNVSSNVQDPAPWASLGMLYLHHGDLTLADQAFVQARTVDPDDATAWAGQGLLASRQGRSDRVRTAYENAIELGQGSILEANYGLANHIFQSGITRTLSNHSTEALFALNTYLIHQPSNPTVLHLSALFCERLELYTEAAENLERAKTLLEEDYDRTESARTARRFGIVLCDLARCQLAQAIVCVQDGRDEMLEHANQNCEAGLGLLDDAGAEDDEGEEGVVVDISQSDLSLSTIAAYHTLAKIHHLNGDSAESFKALDQVASTLESSTLPAETQKTVSSDNTNLRARILYAAESTREEAKSHLLESITSDDSSQVIINTVTLLSIAIVEDDSNLLNEIISELDSTRVLEEVEQLKAARKFIKGNNDLDALNILRSLVAAHSSVSGTKSRRVLDLIEAIIRIVSLHLKEDETSQETSKMATTLLKEARMLTFAALESLRTQTSSGQDDISSKDVTRLLSARVVISRLEKVFKIDTAISDNTDGGVEPRPETEPESDQKKSEEDVEVNAADEEETRCKLLSRTIIQTNPHRTESWRTLALTKS